MKAAKISQTVELAKPDSAQFTAAPVRLKSGLATCAGANSTKRRQRRGDGDAAQADGGGGDRLDHQAGDHRREDREVVPGVLRQAGRRRRQRDRRADQQRQQHDKVVPDRVCGRASARTVPGPVAWRSWRPPGGADGCGAERQATRGWRLRLDPDQTARRGDGRFRARRSTCGACGPHQAAAFPVAPGVDGVARRHGALWPPTWRNSTTMPDAATFSR